jgi:tetratricopeptide (TPR) repeat protein
VADALRQLDAAVAADTTRALEACARWVALRKAAGEGREQEARAHLAALDSLLRTEYVDTGLREAAAYISAVHYEQLGEPEAALRAITKRDHYQLYLLAPSLLMRARLRARTGDREGAIQDYLQFLAMRPDPEPGIATELNRAARRELEQLVGERG